MPHPGGPAVLREGDPRDARVSAELRAALREWTEVADTVLRSGDAHQQDLLRRRGRQLASRVANVLGRPVEFVDPISGTVEPIRAGSNGAVAPRAAPRASDGGGPGRHAVVPEPAGPTPWGTGTAVAAFFAVLAALADIVLADAFAASFGLLWLPANLLVTAGTVPSLWLARRVPFWRWPAYGAAVGLSVAWVVLLLGLLG